MKGPEGFGRSYWVMPGKVLAGCYPGDLVAESERRKLESLLDAGVTLVVNLMEETEKDHQGNAFLDYLPALKKYAAQRSRQVRMQRFPIMDMSIPSPELMRNILDRIREEVKSGGIVFVHCWGGKGRTGTVAGCWLLAEGEVARERVVERLKELTRHQAEFFWPTPQTEEQRHFVCEWEKADA